jgi:hypothetical protein
MRTPTSAAALCSALCAALVLAACSTSSSGDPTTAPSISSGTAPGSSSGTTPDSSSASTATGFPPSSSGSSSSGALSQAQARAALLTAAEVGGGFTASSTDTSDTPLPCTPNAPTLSTRFPPDVKVQADFGGAGGKALFSEEVETFADAATVAQVVTAGEQGLSCSTATVGGVKITLNGPTDLTSNIQVPIDKAEAWSVRSSALNASLVIVQMGRQLVVFSFGAAPSVDTAKLPDPPTLITAGLQKVAAALK